MDFISALVQAHQGFDGARQLIRMSRLLIKLRQTISNQSTGDDLLELFRIAASPNWRQQVYSAVIVQTYATHEKLVRDLARATGDYLTETYSAYGDLPIKTREAHMKLTVRRLQDVTERGHTTSAVDPRTMLNRLATCLGGGVQLNLEVLIRHSSNYRSGVVEEVLGRFDVDVRTASSSEDLSALVGGVLNGVYSTVESVIDDLADRRNEVAHGGRVDSTLGDEDLDGIIDAIRGYDSWLSRQVAHNLLSDLVSRHGNVVGRVAHTWKSKSTGERSIARLLDVQTRLSKGDTAYVSSPQGREVKPCTVASIQVQNVAVDAAIPGEGSFGIEFGRSLSDGWSVRVLEDRWRSLADMLIHACTAT